jgi:hypothetical protein
MTDTNKQQSKYNIGGIGASSIVHFESTFSGNASGGAINVGSQKTCHICQRNPVGLEYPAECQCEKDGNRCEYCQSSDSNKQNCSCHKERIDNKSQKEKTKAVDAETSTIQNRQLTESEKHSEKLSENKKLLIKQQELQQLIKQVKTNIPPAYRSQLDDWLANPEPTQEKKLQQ